MYVYVCMILVFFHDFSGAREGFQLIRVVQTVISGFGSLADAADI